MSTNVFEELLQGAAAAGLRTPAVSGLAQSTSPADHAVQQQACSTVSNLDAAMEVNRLYADIYQAQLQLRAFQDYADAACLTHHPAIAQRTEALTQHSASLEVRGSMRG